MAKYDTFLSFSGAETRNLVASLYKALLREGVHAFTDDQSLNIGEQIQPALFNAIEGSRVFYVVISKGYASSIWCLQELARICYCVETSPRRVLPIFYDVDPSEVRKQIGCFGKAFGKARWREALTRVANRSGWVIGNESVILSHFMLNFHLLSISALSHISFFFKNLFRSYCVHIPEMVRKVTNILNLVPHFQVFQMI